MTMAWQQQVFALDARYNAHRAKFHSNFRTLYIRRRNQLLRECAVNRDNELWKHYFLTRNVLLQNRYGITLDQNSLRRQSLSTRVWSMTTNILKIKNKKIKEDAVVPTRVAEASRAIVGDTSVAENYAFVGVHHIFDQHTAAVTMVKFANNDRARLCCISNDSTISICNVLAQPPSVECILRGHSLPVTGCDWSAANDLIVSCSLDGRLCLWDTSLFKCLRSVVDPVPTQLLACLFHPVNNNIVVAGNARGAVEVLNVSTGIKQRNNMGGRVLSLAFESSGQLLWAGNDQGVILSFMFDMKSGKLSKCRRHYLGEIAAVTSINWRTWISREARDPSLLVNMSSNSVRLYRITNRHGSIELRRRFPIKHRLASMPVRSTFCPIMSFRQGACIVTGSEDSSVYFLDVEREKENKAVFNKLQGHASPVLGVSFNYDESLLSTSDHQGLIIVWARATKHNS
ncbi:hypothetical protein AAG570_011199 [Ranatra chinensis]|uniref:WD repeat-containing protein 13 n=1 Tax=Ranatra chinensis TaxID=642074 RepID=A0ABD0YJY5_9HEMI